LVLQDARTAGGVMVSQFYGQVSFFIGVYGI
jgi:hypothetical protein